MRRPRSEPAGDRHDASSSHGLEGDHRLAALALHRHGRAGAGPRHDMGRQRGPVLQRGGRKRQRLHLLHGDAAALHPRTPAFDPRAHDARQIRSLVHAQHQSRVHADDALQPRHVGVGADGQRDDLDARARQPDLEPRQRRAVDEAVGDEHQHAPRRRRALQFADRQLKRGCKLRAPVRARLPVARQHCRACRRRAERNQQPRRHVENDHAQRIAVAQAPCRFQHGALGQLKTVDAATALPHAARLVDREHDGRRLVQRRRLGNHRQHRLQCRVAISALRKRPFASQHHQAQAAVLDGGNQGAPQARAGIGHGHVVEHHRLQAFERIGLRVQARCRNHVHLPAAAQQAGRQRATRSLHVEQRRGWCDVDHRSVGHAVDRESRRGLFERHVDDHRATGAGVEFERGTARDANFTEGGLRLAAPRSSRGPDTQRRVGRVGRLPRPLQARHPLHIHDELDALTNACAVGRQHLADAGSGR